jgi:hypothetical protein
MRRPGRGIGALALALAMGPGAHAGPLASASLTLELLGVTATFPGVGATGTATSATSATLGGGFAFAGTVTLTGVSASINGTPRSLGKVVVFAHANGAGLFSGATPDQVGGIAPFTAGALAYTITQMTWTVVLHVPITLGKTTEHTIMCCLTVLGAPWSAGAATLTGPSETTAVKATGVNALNATGAGTLTLVAPGRFRSTFPASATLPIVATLTLNYVPEPGTAFLLGGGALLLALLGRRGKRA